MPIRAREAAAAPRSVDVRRGAHHSPRYSASFSGVMPAGSFSVPRTSIYLRSIEVLGALKDPVGISPLKEALYRGEWWAPRRTSTLCGAAAASLARIGTSDALDVLEEAMAAGPRGVRSAVRSHFAGTRAQRSVR